MEKTVDIGGGQLVRMRASALIPRIYRAKFGRDLIRDMTALEKKFNEVTKPGMTEEEKALAQFDAVDLTLFENVAWCMVKHAGEPIPDDPDEWLGTLEMFSIYQVMPAIMELWNFNNATTSVPRKKPV